MTTTEQDIDYPTISISAFGIPCLDYVVKLPTSELLDKYQFPYNGQQGVDLITFYSLLDDIKRNDYEVIKCVGGSAQNILRTFQWLAKVPNKTVMFGVVGEDDDMYTMKKRVENDGVITKYAILDDCKTFGIIILSLQDKRLCVGIQGCKLNYPISYLIEPDRCIVMNSKILHTDGFFLHYSPKFSEHLLLDSTTASCGGKNIVSFNVAWVFGVQCNPRLFMSVAVVSDILFCNKDEFEALIELNDLRRDTSMETIKNFHKLMLSHSHDHDEDDEDRFRWRKIIVVTDGSNPVHCVYGDEDQHYLTADPVRISVDTIVDTTGAGDGFAAGFLYGLNNDFDVSSCLEIGCKTAAKIICQTGVELQSEII